MLISLCRAMIIIAVCFVASMLYENSEQFLAEPDIGAANSGCYLDLVETEPLSFGAVVGSATSATWISLDTDSNVTAQRNKSFVGSINSGNYHHRRGVISLRGNGLKMGSQIAVTFTTTGLSEGIALDNMQFDVASTDNLAQENSSSFQSLILNVGSEGRVQADILYSGRLTLQNTVFGQVNESLQVEGSWDCS